MDEDMYVLPIKGQDIVLGKQWLQKLGKVTHDYSMQTMKFTRLDQGEVLEGFQREQGLLLFRGHGGSKKMLVGLEALFNWKGMRRSVVDFIKRCLVCQQNKYSTQTSGGLLQPFPTPTATDGQIEVVNRSLEQYLWAMLEGNLLAARNRMEMQANRSRREVEFNVGDKVLERVGKVAYRLKLPSTSKIHSVFHVSLLKLFTRASVEGITNLPKAEHEGHPLDQPLVVCATHVILRNGKPICQILVQWFGSSPEEATREELSKF
ncbi:ty3-gypsy retrotransposon protein [Tanacetum coccineum]